jgi:serine/threonine protein kinase/Tol biopolymer transport system component
MIGTTISQYKILEKLGEGGMGVVYKAQDTKLDRFVALKFLPPHLNASQEDKARFIKEAKAASALNHPNVCTIHDIQEHDGQMFIVMEYVEGQTLQEKKSSVSYKQAIDIGIQVADGLAAAHEKGIVHRDIKPENIMIRKDGIAQIMDFGLAKLQGVSRLTKEGSTVGTAGYMSPEQVQGQDADHRSDIFSFGVVLYELLTGGLPFKGIHETALAYEIVNVDPAPMSSVKPEIDATLDAIVLECLEKDPNERSQSAKQIAIDLKRFRRESSKARMSRITAARPVASVRPVGQSVAVPSRSNRFFWPVLAALLVVAVALLLWSPWESDRVVRPVMRFTIDLPADAPLSGGNSTSLAVSPDGRYMVYAGLAGNTTQLYIRRLDQLTSTPIQGTDGAGYPAFSPDDQWIAYDANSAIRKIPVSGGASEKVCDIEGQTRGITWTPDNTILFGHISKGIFRVPAEGGKPEPLTTLDSSANEISHRFPQLLPDGKTVIFTVKKNNIATFDDALIEAQDLDSGKRTVLVRGGTFGRCVPGGYLVYGRGDHIYALGFDPKSLEVKGPPVAIEKGGWLNHGSGDVDMVFSSSGAFIFSPAGPLSFDNVVEVWLDRHGKMQPLLDSARAYFGGTISPDGQRIALTIQAANDDIWVYHRIRGTLTRLTFGGGNHGSPIWSPDGKYVYYFAEKGSSPDIFRKAWDGSGTEERLSNGLNASALTSFRKDGKALAFVQNGDIWILPFGNETKPFPFLQSAAIEQGGQFSPDGRWLAYSSNESGRDEIYVVPYPKKDGKWQISASGGITPLWSSDGKEIFFVNGSKVMVTEVKGGATFDFSVPHFLFDIPPNAFIEDIAPDGKRFVAGVARTQELTQTKLVVVLEWFKDLKDKFSSAKN